MSGLSRNFCYIYIALWMMYYLQGMLAISGVIAKAILIVLMLISFYAFYQVNRYYKTGPYIKWLNIMVLVMTIYGLIPIIGGWSIVGSYIQMPWYNFVSLQRLYSSIVPIYVFYFFSLKKQITSGNLKYIFLFYLIFCIFNYYQLKHSLSLTYEVEEVTNNSSFFFIPLIPMLQLVKMRDLWKFLFIIIIVAYIILCMKRGAILIGSILTFLFLLRNLHIASRRRLLYLIILSSLLLIITYHFVGQLYENSDLFQLRVRQTLNGDSSGRDGMYSTYFGYFMNKTTPLEFIIGNGANATWVLLGNYAHNDWLEFAINQGCLGVVMYFIYWAVFVWEWNNFSGPKECKIVVGDIIIACFLLTLFSMSFDAMVPATTLCIGYCLAMNEKAKMLNKIKALKGKRLSW